MNRAQSNTDKPPQFVISDKLAAYLDGIERVFGADTWHLQSQGFKGAINTNLIERFHGTLKDRTKVMRGLKTRETAKVILSGYLTHYNFFKPHQFHGDLTPAQAAGVRFPYENWTDVVKGGK
jgi:transposase-like protein